MTLDSASQLAFWRRTTRVLQVLLALIVIIAVWLFAFGNDDGPVEVLPDTSEQFSLDLKVVDQLDHGVVYAVEQRARPAYRIFAFDPATGVERTIFTVPEDAIVYGIDLSPDESQLAVAYSTDFNLGGSGLWTLDLTTLDFTEVAPAVPDIFVTEPEWSADASSVLVTHVDRTAETEALSIALVSMADGSIEAVLEQAITPAVQGSAMYYLTVDEQKARRSVGVMLASGNTEIIDVGDGTFDLDHLIASHQHDQVDVAVIESVDSPAITVGTTAGAHGNHNVPSTWWNLAEQPQPTEIDAAVVYDAEISASGSIVYATLEGLTIATDERFDLIESRAIRFVAA